MLKKGIKLILGSTVLGGATGWGYTKYQNQKLEEAQAGKIQQSSNLKAKQQSQSKQPPLPKKDVASLVEDVNKKPDISLKKQIVPIEAEEKVAPVKAAAKDKKEAIEAKVEAKVEQVKEVSKEKAEKRTTPEEVAPVLELVKRMEEKEAAQKFF